VLFWAYSRHRLRGTLILAGVALVQRFHWIIAVFGPSSSNSLEDLFHKMRRRAPTTRGPLGGQEAAHDTTIEGRTSS